MDELFVEWIEAEALRSFDVTMEDTSLTEADRRVYVLAYTMGVIETMDRLGVMGKRASEELQ